MLVELILQLMEKILNAIKMPEVDATINKEAEYQEKLARQQADFDNFRKRMV
jgi:molecular chaperone GrpE (heat shock protein)